VSDAAELYQEVLLDHNRAPRNFGRLAGANRTAAGDNPLCGDRVVIDLEVAEGTVREVRFEGSGCAISTASASLMTEAVKGLAPAQVRALHERMIALVTGAEAPRDDMGKLVAFAGVSDYPMRVKCATLPWHTLIAALDGASVTVSTE
jgi:nitrogen fixation NifU-like protein